MRIPLLLLVVPLLAFGAPARKPVIALLPPSSDAPELVKLGLLMEARAAELLEASGKTREIHMRQVMEMARAERLSVEAMSRPDTAELARQILGADQVVATIIRRTPQGLVLEGTVVEAGKKRSFSSALPDAWSAALAQGSDAIARAILGKRPPTSAVQPYSKSDAALKPLAECWSIALRQPLGVTEPVVIDPRELQDAIASCRTASTLDPELHFALATTALLQAIAGDDVAAARSLKGLGDADDMVESFTLARFWLLTRYQSNEAGLAYLRSVIQRHPDELILSTTLAEDYASLHQEKDAVVAWNAVLAQVPNSPLALGHLSEAHARAGSLEDGLAAAKRALSLAPQSRGAKLRVASRYLDLGRPREAIDALESLATASEASAEHLLKLGRAHFLSGNDAKARTQLDEAVRRAGPAEWRTKGLAHYHLALVEARQRNADGARRAMIASRDTGLRIRDVDPALEALLAEGADKPTPAAVAPLKPRESSLFPFNMFGELEPLRPKPPPPEGLILFRF